MVDPKVSGASTLGMAYQDFQKEIARFLKYGMDSTKWTADDLADIDSVIQSGLRRFYFPAVVQIPGVDTDHQWSFLRPVETLDTVAGTYAYGLPVEFGGIHGDLTYAVGEGGGTVRTVSEGRIRQLRDAQESSGRPAFAAVLPKPLLYAVNDGRAETSFEIIFWPTPDAIWTLTYQAQIRHYKIDPVIFRYPQGGSEHGETILASMLAVAELRFDDQMGVKAVDFNALLAGSIARDKKLTIPDAFGYCGDRSDEKARARQRHLESFTVTVNGVEP